METISEQRLALGWPALAVKVCAAHDAMMAATGNGFRVAECVRSYAQSEIDYEQGRNGHPGKIITNAGPGFSWHNFGMAVDCYPFLQGDAGALDWNADDPEFKSMVSFMKGQGLVWGGDWHSIKDYPHFQPADIPVTPTEEDRAAFASGGMKAVWARYGP